MKSGAAAVELGRDQLMSPLGIFFPSLSYQQDVTFQLASFSLACFYRVIWFPWRFDLVFLLALYKGKGLTTKLTKKVGWGVGLSCSPKRKKKKEKWADIH